MKPQLITCTNCPYRTSLIQKIKNKVNARRARKAREHYIRGYDYAAGVLLRGEKTVTELEAEMPSDSTFGDLNPAYLAFSDGVDDACSKLVTTGVVVIDEA